MKRTLCLVMVMLMLTACLAGCGGNGRETSVKEDKSKPIVWYIPYANLPGQEEVFEKATEYIKEKIGYTVEFNPISMGDYATKMQVIDASREEYDIAFASNWLNNYQQNVNKGCYAELDELLPKYAPYTYNEMVKKEVWDGVRVKGKIYGVINNQVYAAEPVLYLAKNNLEAFGMKAEEITNLDKLTEYFEKVHEKTGEYVDGSFGWGVWGLVEGFESVLPGGIPGMIKYGEEGKPTLINQYETEEYKEFIRVKREWCEKGLTSPVALESNDKKKIALEQKGSEITSLGAAFPATIYSAGTAVSLEKEWYTPYEYVRILNNPRITTATLTAALNVVSATSTNPAGALRVIDLVNSDPYLMNLLVFGIEGTHYEKIGDNKIELNEDLRYVASSWAIGNTLNLYTYGDQPEDTPKIDAETNANGLTSPIFGFTADIEDVKIEVSNCTAVATEYVEILEKGLADVDETYAEFMKKMKAAGCDKIIEHVQKQLDAWYEAQK